MNLNSRRHIPSDDSSLSAPSVSDSSSIFSSAVAFCCLVTAWTLTDIVLVLSWRQYGESLSVANCCTDIYIWMFFFPLTLVRDSSRCKSFSAGCAAEPLYSLMFTLWWQVEACADRNRSLMSHEILPLLLWLLIIFAQRSCLHSLYFLRVDVFL